MRLVIGSGRGAGAAGPGGMVRTIRFNGNLILVTGAGGTIAGVQLRGGRGYKAAAFSTEALIAAVPQLAEVAHVAVESVAAIGSCPLALA